MWSSLGGEGAIVDTFHSFKGLESDVVVAVLPDFSTPALAERHRGLTYVGLSRARVHLIVIGSPDVRAQLRWPAV